MPAEDQVLRSRKEGRSSRKEGREMVRLRRSHRQPSIACFAACDDCAHLIGNPDPGEEDIRMAIMHASHTGELEAIGWITTQGEAGVPDCCCPHYHAANWIGEHGDDCCGGA